MSTSQALYGSTRGTAVRAGLLAAAVPVTVYLSPWQDGRPLAWLSGPVLGLVPPSILFAVLMRVLLGALQRQEETAAREALLATASRQLIGLTDGAGSTRCWRRPSARWSGSFPA